MGDNSVIFHGVSITPKYTDPQPDPIFCGIAINYLESELVDNLPLSPKFYGAIIKGYIHPNNIPLTATSKKVYITDKGNILINPNDTVLIEI